MKTRTGVTFDALGRPTGAVSRDDGPSRARTTAYAVSGHPAFRGTLVVGQELAKSPRSPKRATESGTA